MSTRYTLLAALLIGLIASHGWAAPSGELVGWGRNNEGQVTVPSGNDFVAIAAGYVYSLALKSDGSLAAWGDNSYGQTDTPAGNDFVAIDAGYAYSLALKSDGSLAAWGSNYFGQTNVPEGNDFVAIAAGGYHCLALKSDGSLAAWGDNSWGATNVPAGNDFVAIEAGESHNLALKSDGSLAGWGLNNDGQTNVPAGNDFVAITAGGRHSQALKSDGSVTAWGTNANGEMNVPAGNNFVAVDAGYAHTLAVKSDGSLAAWGYSWDGRTNVPAGTGFLAIAGGGTHSLAIRQVLDFSDVLVSNIAEPVRDNTPIANPEFWAAQSFVSDDLRHSISSIEAIVGNSLDSPQVVAELRKADVNNEIDLTPGGLLTKFTFADLPAGNPAAHLFSPEHSVNLEPNTRYWFVLGSSNEGTFDWSYAEGGHFIGPGTLSDFADSSDAGTTWTYGAGPFNPYLIQVKIADFVLAGDYNNDGTVDAADYVVWRKNLGQPAGTLLNDTDGGVIGTAQYDTWRAHFGDTTFSGSGATAAAAVPEPSSCALIFFGMGLLFLTRRRYLQARRESLVAVLPIVAASVIAVAAALISATVTKAALIPLPSPTPETPGVSLGLEPNGLSGTVIATLDSPFIDNALPTPFAQGTFRTLVVDRGAGLLDFYYQVANTSAPPADPDKEFYRFKTTGGFPLGSVIAVGQAFALANLIAGPGSNFDPANYNTNGKPAATADRDVGTPGSIGFEFSFFTGNLRNIGAGESSMFLIARTDATQFRPVRVAISGAATSFADTYAVVPEPSTFLLLTITACATLLSRCR